MEMIKETAKVVRQQQIDDHQPQIVLPPAGELDRAIAGRRSRRDCIHH